MKARWHILRDGARVTLARQVPVRFDFAVTATLGPGDPNKLAHQIRQDLWRALQRVRGFSPVVALEPVAEGWTVTAGGRVAGRASPRDIARAQAVLDNRANRARWARFAATREVA
ncbi:MAG: hypothetical protein AAFN94_15290 [Pseudomonadota bacterium]